MLEAFFELTHLSWLVKRCVLKYVLKPKEKKQMYRQKVPEQHFGVLKSSGTSHTGTLRLNLSTAWLPCERKMLIEFH